MERREKMNFKEKKVGEKKLNKIRFTDFQDIPDENGNTKGKNSAWNAYKNYLYSINKLHSEIDFINVDWKKFCFSRDKDK